jgi:demethylmenaquinone methyltransferase/2-methoxy-6-polyprenyl-1,4-benzoquinol methylase
MSRAELDKSPGDVAAMFDDVAPRYDRTNAVLSMGMDRGWRKVVAETAGLQKGETALDLAAGTGTSSAAIAARGGHVVACDFSLGMLSEGRKRRSQTAFVAGDALKLPFADSVFDAVTISFGLRNLSNMDAGLAEMLRVTRPGGRLVICEFSHPTFAPFRAAYMNYLMRALPAIATRVSSNPDAYVYLAESIRAWPGQDALAHRIRAAGWDEVKYRNLTGGIVAVHKAVRP